MDSYEIKATANSNWNGITYSSSNLMICDPVYKMQPIDPKITFAEIFSITGDKKVEYKCPVHGELKEKHILTFMAANTKVCVKCVGEFFRMRTPTLEKINASKNI